MNPRIKDISEKSIAPSFNVTLNYLQLQIMELDTNHDNRPEKIIVKVSANIDPASVRSVAIIQQFSFQIDVTIQN